MSGSERRTARRALCYNVLEHGTGIAIGNESAPDTEAASQEDYLMNALPLCPSCHREVPPSSRFCPVLRLGLARWAEEAPDRTPSRQPAPLQSLPGHAATGARGDRARSTLCWTPWTAASNAPSKEMSEAQLGPLERDKAVNDFLARGGYAARARSSRARQSL